MRWLLPSRPSSSSVLLLVMLLLLLLQLSMTEKVSVVTASQRHSGDE